MLLVTQFFACSDFVERSRMEVRSVKGEIERQKKREKDLQERKIEFKKRIALFRKVRGSSNKIF